MIVCGAMKPLDGSECTCDHNHLGSLVRRLREEVLNREMHGVVVTGGECMGLCEHGPVVVAYPNGEWYAKVDESSVGEVLDEVRNMVLTKASSGCAGCHH